MGNIIAAIAVLGALGALFGLILSVASKIFEVKKDPREEAILSHLAGANCGGCGYFSRSVGACHCDLFCSPDLKINMIQDHITAQAYSSIIDLI